MVTDRITEAKLRIKVHHVGGIGDYGPTNTMGNIPDVDWIVYDADEESLAASTDLEDKSHILVNKCIGGVNSKTNFNIMFARSASSILLPSPSAAAYTYPNSDGSVQVWGEHTRVVRSPEVTINTLDWLFENGEIPTIDLLSIDAQGAELDIINGASQMMSTSVIGVVCEVEFAELYAGQPLFCDIQDRLRRDHFRLCQIYNLQYFNTAPYDRQLQGAGFLTVGEALFLKDVGSIIDSNSLDELTPDRLAENVIQCPKLAATAVVFDQLDYAIDIIHRLKEKRLLPLDDLAEKCDTTYIRLLRDLASVADRIEKDRPDIRYRSSNEYDEPSENAGEAKRPNDFAVLWEKALLASRLIFTNARRSVCKKLGRDQMSKYYSEISNIYSRYGMNNLANRHERRFFKFLLLREPRPTNGLTRLLSKLLLRRDELPRNDFQGF